MATSFQLLQYNEHEYFYLSYENSDEQNYNQTHPKDFQSVLQKAFKMEDYTETIDSNTFGTTDADNIFSENCTVALLKQIRNIKQLDYFVNQRIEKLDKAFFRCKVCGHQTHKTCNIKYHIERKHFRGLQIQCSFCNEFFEQKPGERILSAHIRKHETSECVWRLRNE